MAAARRSFGEGRPLLRVVLEHVAREVAALSERYTAYRTFIRFFARVDPDMSFEILGLVETPTTHSTVERPMRGVGRHV